MQLASPQLTVNGGMLVHSSSLVQRTATSGGGTGVQSLRLLEAPQPAPNAARSSKPKRWMARAGIATVVVSYD
jgi:hypothetical protein